MTGYRHVWVLLARQWFLVRNNVVDNIINYMVIWPALFSGTSGYLVPRAFFPQNAVMKGTELIVGMVFLQFFVVSYFAVVELLSERDESRVLQYHVQATSYTATFISRLLFYTMYTYILVLPFLPMCKLFLGSYFFTDNAQWLMMPFVLFLVSLTVVSYVFCVFCTISTIRELEYAWAWGIEPVLWLSGMWAPSYVIAQSSLPGMNYFIRCNPFAYATESVRQLFFSDVQFASLPICCGVMCISAALCSLASYLLMKRQIQAV